MPPKKAAAAPSKKTENKKKEKIIEDKTFGLKNKKGAKTQKFIQHVEKQVKFGNANARQIQLQQEAVTGKKTKAELEKKKLEELQEIFRPVATQKLEKGVDPKSVLCAFFKQGICGKGDKCKFSHDIAIERKAEKKSVYVDGHTEDTMADWDEAKLAEVIEKKHGAANKSQTDIICKYFIDAVEGSKYGWFWECPNGGNKCMYRHCLPPGFVLKKDQKKDEKGEEITIEELVERERAKLGYDLPKINLESFVAWKKRKIEERRKQAAKDEEKRRAEFKAGRNTGLSGRDMFTFNPDLATDGDYDDGEGIIEYIREDDDEDDEEEAAQAETTQHTSGDKPKQKKQIKELDLDELARFNEQQSAIEAPSIVRHRAPDPGEASSSSGDPTAADPGPSTSRGAAAASSSSPEPVMNGVPISEDLFEADDDELDEIDEELNDLKL